MDIIDIIGLPGEKNSGIRKEFRADFTILRLDAANDDYDCIELILFHFTV